MCSLLQAAVVRGVAWDHSFHETSLLPVPWDENLSLRVTPERYSEPLGKAVFNLGKGLGQTRTFC